MRASAFLLNFIELTVGTRALSIYLSEGTLTNTNSDRGGSVII